MIPTAVVGCVAHYRHGNVIPRLAIPLGVGSFIGSCFMGIAGKKIHDKYLQYGFALTISALGLRVLLQAVRTPKL
jgi:uncharacterized membrane protein YfcA